MAGPRFNNTIDFGHVLTILTLLVALWGASAAIRERIALIEFKVDQLWMEYAGRIPSPKS